MYFSKKLSDDEEYHKIESTNLDNNILITKHRLDINQHYIISLKDNQSAILFEKGKLYDIVKEKGLYTIQDGKGVFLPEDLDDYQEKQNQDNLCVMFFNQNEIINNKFYIKKILRRDFYGEGEFTFQVNNPIKLFNKVLQIRSIYSREELLEQIRDRISKIVISVIKNNKTEYIKLEESIYLYIDIFEEYGIKIISSDIKNIKFKKNI